MTERLAPGARRDPYGSRINRSHSPVIAYAIPYASILLACLLPIFVMTSAVPLVPPLGFLFLIAWRQSRPGLLPIWIGLPLGLFNDLYSGQPMGSSALLWSLAMIAMEIVETRFPWRSFVQDWGLASALVFVFLLASALFSGATPNMAVFKLIGLQVLLSVLAYPIIGRMVARLDRLRLMRWRVIG